MVAVVSRAALRAEESHDAWLCVFIAVTKQPPDTGRAACPNCGRFNVRFQYVADPDSRIGFCALWCTNCFHGHVLGRTRVPDYLDFLPLDSSEAALRKAIPQFVDVVAEELAGAPQRTERLSALRPIGAEQELRRTLTDRDVSPSLLPVLTPREREIATLLVSGLTRRDIAERLELSPSTVQSFLERIYWRLGHEVASGDPGVAGRRAKRRRRRTS